jgi:hypothetical protein
MTRIHDLTSILPKNIKNREIPLEVQAVLAVLQATATISNRLSKLVVPVLQGSEYVAVDALL